MIVSFVTIHIFVDIMYNKVFVFTYYSKIKLQCHFDEHFMDFVSLDESPLRGQVPTSPILNKRFLGDPLIDKNM